uniref:Calpain catalytic domain-containing protein n=1 Tax=Hucho hucho TaxID=62062 RepID=A0A4W5Q8A0_9TELE
MPPPGVCMSIMQERNKEDGVGSLANAGKYRNQDFQQLKQYCLDRRVRYIDQMFPPDHNSIGEGLLSPDDMGRVVWLRPAKIAQNPDFIISGFSRFDFGQGSVANCWFLASVGALTFQKHILEQVVPLEQGFKDDYCGIFHFRFWRFGRWVDVVIDDMLPTIDGRLIFVHSKTPNEFWPALMEKAYAKVCGSYADMNAGTPSEAMMDFTGGVHITFKLAETPPNLWDLLFRAAKFKSLIGCNTPQGETSVNTLEPNGLVRGHAYTVTGVLQVLQGRPVNLIRLFNPWGYGEWKGDWSDKSSMWKTVSPDDRKMYLSVEEDGEFWMTMENFCEHFSDVTICCLCPDFLDGNSEGHWTPSFHDGRWVAGTTAGGCIKFRDSFWTNPQYRVKIEGLDRDFSETQGDNNMLVSLMQKPDKRNRRLVKSVHIGINIFEFKGQRGKFPASFFNNNAPVAQTKNYLNARTVMLLCRLKPGEYLIVPSSFKPNETASFILSILSKFICISHSQLVFKSKEGRLSTLQCELGAVHQPETRAVVAMKFCTTVIVMHKSAGLIVIYC